MTPYCLKINYISKTECDEETTESRPVKNALCLLKLIVVEYFHNRLADKSHKMQAMVL